MKEKAAEEGYELLSSYVRDLVLSTLGRPVQQGIDRAKLKSMVARITQDVINQYVSVIEDLKRKYAELIERIENLETRINELQSKLSKQTARYQYYQPTRQPSKRQRKSGIERLREEKVLFESSLRGLKNRDSFFKYLEREGAKVIVLDGERVAIDREYWDELKRRIFEEISTNIDDEIKKILDPIGYEIFQRLKRSGLIYYDSSQQRWRPVDKSLIG